MVYFRNNECVQTRDQSSAVRRGTASYNLDTQIFADRALSAAGSDELLWLLLNSELLQTKHDYQAHQATEKMGVAETPFQRSNS